MYFLSCIELVVLLYVLVELCCLFCIFFFFFKQKTAYEMRISDWSSDVCSSDLTNTERLIDSTRTVADHRPRRYRLPWSNCSSLRCGTSRRGGFGFPHQGKCHPDRGHRRRSVCNHNCRFLQWRSRVPASPQSAPERVF